MDNKFTLGIIGAGNMATAIVGGILKSGLLNPQAIVVSDSDRAKLDIFKDKGLNVTLSNVDAAKHCEYLLLAVKPQIAPAVFSEISEEIYAHTVISVMAGISICRLGSNLGQRNYARVMPNTPALVGEGMAAVAFSEGFFSDFVLDIFSSLGKVVVLDETLFDAVTSLSGSGPAYVYTFIKALIEGGADGGLDYDVAKKLALQTVRGAVEMIEQSDKSVSELIDAVCSKGGTTIQAIESFKEDNLENIVKKGMEKCRLKSKELGSV